MKIISHLFLIMLVVSCGNENNQFEIHHELSGKTSGTDLYNDNEFGPCNSTIRLFGTDGSGYTCNEVQQILFSYENVVYLTTYYDFDPGQIGSFVSEDLGLSALWNLYTDEPADIAEILNCKHNDDSYALIFSQSDELNPLVLDRNNYLTIGAPYCDLNKPYGIILEELYVVAPEPPNCNFSLTVHDAFPEPGYPCF